MHVQDRMIPLVYCAISAGIAAFSVYFSQLYQSNWTNRAVWSVVAGGLVLNVVAAACQVCSHRHGIKGFARTVGLSLLTVAVWFASGSGEVRADDRDQLLRLIESERVRAEENRLYLKRQKDQLVGDLMLLASQNPGAAAHVGTIVGSASWASDPSLDEDAKTFLSGIAIAGVVTCVFDYDCLSMANKMVKLSERADHLQSQINALSEDVGYPLFVKNTCHLPLNIGLTYLDLEGEWRNFAWWSYEPGEEAYPMYGNSRIRSRNSVFYYYAETSGSSGHLEWGGPIELVYGGNTYRGRKAQLNLDDNYNYILDFSCP